MMMAKFELRLCVFSHGRGQAEGKSPDVDNVSDELLDDGRNEVS